MRLAALLVLCLSMVPGPAAPAEAEAASAVQMTVRAGFEGAGKIGGWLPVVVDVRNDGDDVDGEVQIVVQDTTSNRGTYTPAPTVFSVPALLPRRSRKQLQMEVRLPSTGQRIRARLLDANGTLLDQDVQLTRVSPGDLLCGVLSRTSSALEFIPTIELPPPLRRVRLAHLELNDLPARPYLFSSLDCLIVDNMPMAGLSDVQADALRNWVANGGLLIVAGGAGWQKTFAGLPADLLPVRVTGMTTVSNLTNLADFGREQFAAGGQYLASQAVVTDGNAVVEEDGVPLLVSARRGLGSVFYLGLDPATDPLRGWAGSVSLWRFMLSHSATGAALGPGGSSPLAGWGRIPRNALTDISLLRPPALAPLVGGLLLFTLLVGPLNFLVLRRLGQPTWALATVPLLTGVAGLLIFGMAAANRDSDSIATEVTIVRTMPNAQVGQARTYVGLLSRQQGTYDVRAPDGALLYGLFYPFPRDPSTEGPNWALKVVNGSRPSVSDLSLSSGSLATFGVDGVYRPPGGLETDLTTDGRSLTGTVTNRTGSLIADASLIVDFAARPLGDIKPGETREIDFPLAPTASAGYGPPPQLASQLYPSGVPQKKPSDAARRDILDSAFGQAFNFSKLDLYGPTLLGWIEGAPIDLDVRPSRPAVVDNTMYVATLPIRLAKGYEGDVPAALVTHRTLGATTASRQQWGSYELATGESVALQFSLPIQPGRFLLERLNLNVDGRMRGPGAATAGFGPIQFFNWRTSEWEEYTFWNGATSIPSPTAYVSSTGDVRVRYTFRPPAEANVTGVTFNRFDISATGLMR